LLVTPFDYPTVYPVSLTPRLLVVPRYGFTLPVVGRWLRLRRWLILRFTLFTVYGCSLPVVTFTHRFYTTHVVYSPQLDVVLPRTDVCSFTVTGCYGRDSTVGCLHVVARYGGCRLLHVTVGSVIVVGSPRLVVGYPHGYYTVVTFTHVTHVRGLVLVTLAFVVVFPVLRLRFTHYVVWVLRTFGTLHTRFPHGLFTHVTVYTTVGYHVTLRLPRLHRLQLLPVGYAHAFTARMTFTHTAVTARLHTFTLRDVTDRGLTVADGYGWFTFTFTVTDVGFRYARTGLRLPVARLRAFATFAFPPRTVYVYVDLRTLVRLVTRLRLIRFAGSGSRLRLCWLRYLR